MRQAASIVCIGGANVDRKARLLTPFRLGTSHPVATTQTAGGVARNIAENLGRLAQPVSLVSTVGDDRDGQWLIDVTSRYVDSRHIVRTSKANTGTYTAVLDERGEMVLALADMVIYDTVGKEWMKQRWPELGPISAVVLDTNFSSNAIQWTIEQCRRERLPLCVVTVSVPKVKRLPADLSGVTWLITNEAEAKALAEDDGRSVSEAMEALVRLGVENVVVTRGANGVAYATKQGETGAIAAPKVEATDATGAGDAFAAGFLYGVLGGHTVEDACRFGMSSASLTLQTAETVHSALNEHLLQAAYARYFREGGTK
ncbi:carbohydrate kinase family protein [Geobacillus proteiniphilus]|uniref:Carbohydrate kinase family protein n=1 Tax=Geobacillus proteiniphilus TaxID=860353 RepID=A0A1Q5SR52_9BACL|nr:MULTISPECIES: carbohydrate kinase family protein [Geobacillus]OKO90396.1 Pseudouridine kinase [Geobacillus proteiniphilus]OPX02956.1 sugar kinase [Geobacillus sp. LEMMY01]WMJ15109.1 carbohydrate kinase family protein [Geobacillus proteiniphilus]